MKVDLLDKVKGRLVPPENLERAKRNKKEGFVKKYGSRLGFYRKGRNCMDF